MRRRLLCALQGGEGEASGPRTMQGRKGAGPAGGSRAHVVRHTCPEPLGWDSLSLPPPPPLA